MRMDAQEFRLMFPKLGVAGELLIANVIVGNMDWVIAIRLGNKLMDAFEEGRLK